MREPPTRRGTWLSLGHAVSSRLRERRLSSYVNTFLLDCVYVDSRRPDVPYFICSVKEFYTVSPFSPHTRRRHSGARTGGEKTACLFVALKPHTLADSIANQQWLNGLVYTNFAQLDTRTRRIHEGPHLGLSFRFLFSPFSLSRNAARSTSMFAGSFVRPKYRNPSTSRSYTIDESNEVRWDA